MLIFLPLPLKVGLGPHGSPQQLLCCSTPSGGHRPPGLRATLMLPLASQTWERILPSLQTSPRLEPHYRGCRAPQAPPVLGQERRADSDMDGQRPTASRGDAAIARHPGGQAGLWSQHPAGEHSKVTPEGRRRGGGGHRVKGRGREHPSLASPSLPFQPHAGQGSPPSLTSAQGSPGLLFPVVIRPLQVSVPCFQNISLRNKR